MLIGIIALAFICYSIGVTIGLSLIAIFVLYFSFLCAGALLIVVGEGLARFLEKQQSRLEAWATRAEENKDVQWQWVQKLEAFTNNLNAKLDVKQEAKKKVG